jgi:hypothetical protein
MVFAEQPEAYLKYLAGTAFNLGPGTRLLGSVTDSGRSKKRGQPEPKSWPSPMFSMKIDRKPLLWH